MAGAILEAAGVTKHFGALTAVDRVDFALAEHEVAGIIGSNGAGKTTFFNLLTGYLSPDEGSIRYRGQDLEGRSPQQRVALGITRTFQLASAFDALTVVDNLVLVFVRAQRNATLAQLLLSRCRAYREQDKVVAALRDFDLMPIRNRLVQHISLGEKRRLEIAMAVLAEPAVLLLDEPLAGLAEPEIKAIIAVLRSQIGRRAMLIVEHKISHVENFVQRLAVMHEGRIIAQGGYEECLRHPEVRRSYWQIADGEARA